MKLQPRFLPSRAHIILHISCLLAVQRLNCHSHVCTVACLSTVSPLSLPYVCMSDGQGAAGEACWRHQATSALLLPTRAACAQGCLLVPTIQMAFP